MHDKIRFIRRYRHTCVRFQPLNTVCRICVNKEAGRLEGVTDNLMISEYLNGKQSTEKKHMRYASSGRRAENCAPPGFSYFLKADSSFSQPRSSSQ